MTSREIADEKRRIEEKHGAWTHNLRLGEGVYTRGPAAVAGTWRIRRYLQIVADFGATAFDKMRVLELACFEGMYGAEFAARGASVLGVEIRDANIEKARFAKRVLELDSLELRQDDVRNVSRERDGAFDVVICSGILYHLEAAQAVRLIHTLRTMTTRLLIVDTRIALRAKTSAEVEGRRYHGSLYREHAPGSSAAERVQDNWASIDNETSFWFTRESLVNLMRHAGFGSVYECHAPGLKKHAEDRASLVGLPSARVEPMLSPTAGLDERDLPERSA